MIEESRKDLKFCIAAKVAEELGDAVTGMVRKAFLEGKLSQFSESMAVDSVFKDVISSEKYWKVQNNILLHNDILMNRPAYGSSYITLSKKQMEDLSDSLFHPILRKRLKAMEYLIRCVSTDSSHVNAFWDRLSSGLQLNLTSPLGVISEASLQVYKKFLVSSTPEVSLEVYISLLNVLSSIFHKEDCMPFLPNVYLVSDIVQLINKFQRNVSKYWSRYPINVITGIVSKTFECYEQCQWSSEDDRDGLGHYLWLVDEQGLWLNSFLCGIVSRQTVYQSVKMNRKILWDLLETCHLYLEDVFEQNIPCVIGSVSILIRLMEKKEGRTCLLEQFFRDPGDTPSWFKSYSSLESIWMLVSTVCFNLVKSNDLTWLTVVLCRLIQNQIDKDNSHDTQLIVCIFNEMCSNNDPSYLLFVSDCISKLTKDSKARKFLLSKETELRIFLEELSRFTDLDSTAPPILVEKLEISRFQILSNMLLEPLAVLMFGPQKYRELLHNISEWIVGASQHCSGELLNFVVILSESELGNHTLFKNPKFLEMYFKNFSIETLFSDRSLTRFTLQILNLPLPSTAVEEVLHYLMNQLENSKLADICQDSDFPLWTTSLNQYFENISYFSFPVLQIFNNFFKHKQFENDFRLVLLPMPQLNCDKCSEIFQLNVLNYLLCDVNSLIYFSAYSNIQKCLLAQQTKSFSESVQIIDERSVLRNHILVRISVIGGSKERHLPSKHIPTSEKVIFVREPSDLSSYVLHKVDSKEQFNITANLNHNQVSNYFQELISIRTLSVKDCMQFINILIENVEELEFEVCNISDVTSVDLHGIEMTLYYGRYQSWLSSISTETQENHLLTLLKRKPTYNRYNILAATVFLLCGGDLQTSAQFLTLLESSRNKSLSVVTLFDSIQDTSPNSSKGVLCGIFDWIIQEEIPLLYNTMLMISLPPHKCLTLWLGQCFWNILNMDQIATIILLSVIQNANFLVYTCVTILKHLEHELYEQFEHGDAHSFVREYFPSDFNLNDNITYLNELNKKYCGLIDSQLSLW